MSVFLNDKAANSGTVLVPPGEETAAFEIIPGTKVKIAFEDGEVNAIQVGDGLIFQGLKAGQPYAFVHAIRTSEGPYKLATWVQVVGEGAGQARLIHYTFYPA